MRMTSIVTTCLALGLPALAVAEIQIYSMDHETGRLIKIKEDGTLVWDCSNRNGHDVQLLPNGNVLIVTGKVQEINPEKKVVWELGAPTIKFAESAQRLPNGHTVIGDTGQMAIIEVDADNKVVWRYDVLNANKRPNPTFRQIRRLPNGNTLISASTEDEVIEVAPDKSIVWRYKLPFPYLATRFENGNTLISSGTGYGSPRRLLSRRSRSQGRGCLEIRRSRRSDRSTPEMAFGLCPTQGTDLYLRSSERRNSRRRDG